jgi:hypothetical protein
MDYLYIFFQVLLVSIAATSCMTLFSYVMAASFKELYKEPVLLTFLFRRMNFQISSQSKIILGWLSHYIIGFFFVLAYHFIWNHIFLDISITNTLLLGVISGIIGVINWMFIFRITKHEPPIDFRGYYIQLFFAHIIFTLIATGTYHVLFIVSLLGNAYATL